MSGFGGAGAFSDGKFNITNDFGGTLYEYKGRRTTMFCPECGKKIPNESIFCENCGTRVKNPDSKMKEQVPVKPQGGHKQPYKSPLHDASYYKDPTYGKIIYEEP